MNAEQKDLSGISFGGVPLNEELPFEGVDKKISEFIKDDIREKRKCLPKSDVKQKEDPKRKITKRVRYLPPKEIRKEYGIMECPYETNVENVLWVIKNKGPISVIDISTILGKSAKSIGSTASELYARLDDQVWKKLEHPKSKTFLYSLNPEIDMSVEALHAEFRRKSNEHTAKRKKELKEEIAKAENERYEEMLSEPNVDQKQVEKQIENQIIPKDVRITIKVEGSIKILFGFSK